MSGMSRAKARQSFKTRNSGKSRAKAGLVAKAGKRRPPHIMKDKNGDYVANNSHVSTS